MLSYVITVARIEIFKLCENVLFVLDNKYTLHICAQQLSASKGWYVSFAMLIYVLDLRDINF